MTNSLKFQIGNKYYDSINIKFIVVIVLVQFEIYHYFTNKIKNNKFWHNLND